MLVYNYITCIIILIFIIKYFNELFKFFSEFLNECILTSIDARGMILPPFDSSRLDDSNELNYTFLRSIDAKIFRQNVFFYNDSNLQNIIWF